MTIKQIFSYEFDKLVSEDSRIHEADDLRVVPRRAFDWLDSCARRGTDYRVGPRSHGGPLTPRSVLFVLRGSIETFTSQPRVSSEKSPMRLNHCLFIP